jgi:hypothetical protein
MNEEKRKVLDMLAQGKITVDEAEKLLNAISEPSEEVPTAAGGKRSWKYLRVLVEPGPGSESNDKVNVRIPFKLIRAGLKFAAFIPREYQGKVDAAFKEKGMNVDLAKITPEDLEEIVSNLDDMTVEVDGKDKVRVFCE